MPDPRKTPESPADAELPPFLWEDDGTDEFGAQRCIICGGPRGAAHAGWAEEHGLERESH